MGWHRRKWQLVQWFWEGPPGQMPPWLALLTLGIAALFLWARLTSVPWVRVTIYAVLVSPVALIVGVILFAIGDHYWRRSKFYSARLDRQFDRHFREHPFKDTTMRFDGHKRVERHRR